MQEVDDWELVARTQAGDNTAFAELVRRYQVPVIHFCRRMLDSLQDAEDVAQDSFVRLHRSVRRLRPEAKFSTVLFGIARNLALNHLRDADRRGRGRMQPFEAMSREPSGGQADQPDHQARRQEIEAALEAGIAKLSKEHREVLLLREFQGLDYSSIARIVRCRKGTVRSRLARAREQLCARLRESGGDLL